MQTVASPKVWAQMTTTERTAVGEGIVRVLTEEVENEQFRKDSSHASGATSRRLHPSVRSQAGAEASRERHQPARPARAAAGAGLAEKPDRPHRRGPGTVREGSDSPRRL